MSFFEIWVERTPWARHRSVMRARWVHVGVDVRVRLRCKSLERVLESTREYSRVLESAREY